MRILLTSPVSRARYDYFRHIAARRIRIPIRSYIPSLALGYLKASLENTHQVTSIHPRGIRDLRKHLDGTDVVGITCTTGDYPDALETARRVKGAAPETLLVMGGPHVSVQDVEALEAGPVDVVVRGEGEEIMQEICGSTPLEGIEGISYKRDGKIVRNASRQLPVDLKRLPFPRSVGWVRFLWFKRSFGAVVSSRGCPHNCSFCMTSRLQGQRWRARAVEDILSELEQFSGNPYLFFMDDNFTLDPRRVETLCEAIKERSWTFRWACLSRADTIARHPNLLGKMFDAGLIALLMGVESSNPASLREARKGQTRKTIQEAFECVKEYPIISVASIIFGFDSDTLDTLDENTEFLLSLDPTVVQATVLTPFPGTEIYSQCAAEGRILTSDWSMYDALHCVFQPKNFSRQDLESKVSECYRRFYGTSKKRRERLRGLSLFLKGRL